MLKSVHSTVIFVAPGYLPPFDEMATAALVLELTDDPNTFKIIKSRYTNTGTATIEPKESK